MQRKPGILGHLMLLSTLISVHAQFFIMSEWACGFVLKKRKWPVNKVIAALREEGCAYGGGFTEMGKNFEAIEHRAGIRELVSFFEKGGQGVAEFSSSALGAVKLYFMVYGKMPSLQVAADGSVIASNLKFRKFVKVCSAVSKALDYEFGLDDDGTGIQASLAAWSMILSGRRGLDAGVPFMLFVGTDLFKNISTDELRNAGAKIEVFDNGVLFLLGLPQDQRTAATKQAVQRLFQ